MKTAYTALLVCFFSAISFLPQPALQRVLFVLPVLAAGVALAVWLGRGRRGAFDRSDWPVLLFVLCLGAGFVNALYTRRALSLYAMTAPACVSSFYIGKSRANAGAGFGVVAAVVCACMSVVALIAVLELATGRNFLYEGIVHNTFYVRYSRFSSRPMSTLYNPVVAGSYFIGCLPFCFYFLKRAGLSRKAFGAVLLCACVALVILTSSRGVFLGLGGMSLCYCVLRKKWRTAIAIGAAALVFVSVASMSSHPGLRQFGIKKIVAGSQDSMISQYRLERVAMAGRVLARHPFAGMGLGHFRLRFYEFASSPRGELVPYELMIPDNMYLSLLSESGIIGTFGFLLFCGWVFYRALRNYHADQGADRWMRIVPLAGFAGLLVNMAAYDLFYWHNPFALLCFLAGLSTAGKGMEQ